MMGVDKAGQCDLVSAVDDPSLRWCHQIGSNCLDGLVFDQEMLVKEFGAVVIHRYDDPHVLDEQA
ncbi:MAG: hypothetical protein QGF28_06545, partial [Candidatus Thalassarchaeaceae archaeon]|jgi:hypothetical protein|nr:hypothetical protein [Candidatus Thalassarchaeaceae archaeon]